MNNDSDNDSDGDHGYIMLMQFPVISSTTLSDDLEDNPNRSFGLVTEMYNQIMYRQHHQQLQLQQQHQRI